MQNQEEFVPAFIEGKEDILRMIKDIKDNKLFWSVFAVSAVVVMLIPVLFFLTAMAPNVLANIALILLLLAICFGGAVTAFTAVITQRISDTRIKEKEAEYEAGKGK